VDEIARAVAQEAERALELDPLSPSANAEVARVLVAHGRCDDGLDLLEKLAPLEPPLLRIAAITAQCHARSERWPDAIGVLRSQVDRGVAPNSPALLGHMLARAGQRDEALRIRADLLERWRSHDAGAFLVAIVDAGLGDLDEAFVWLERAVEDRSLKGWPHHFTKMDILRERMGDDPRFEGLRERTGLRSR
jgi:tetratricopeptide (TPR) repeat protein